MPRLPAALLVLALLPSAGCFLVNSAGSSQPSASSGSGSANLVAQLDQQRARAKTGEPSAVIGYAQMLIGIQANTSSMAAYGDVDWVARSDEALELLDVLGEISEDPQVRLQSAAASAWLLIAIGRKDEAVAPVEKLHDASPSVDTAVTLLGVHRLAEVPLEDPAGFCAGQRLLAQSDAEVHLLLEQCALTENVAVASLSWPTEEDKATYLRVQEEIEAANVARAQAEEQRRYEEEQRAAAASSSGSAGSPGGSGPSGPAIVSVSLKNGCSSTVKLFFGDKPKFGSGRYSSLGSNTRTSQQMQEGDMIWIVDDGQNGLASYTVSASSRDVEIGSDCASFR